jgi:hypothetical protein
MEKMTRQFFNKRFHFRDIAADKSVSTMHGCRRLIKKAVMDETMLRDREAVLADTVELMALNEWFSLGLSVSERMYLKYCTPPESKEAV